MRDELKAKLGILLWAQIVPIIMLVLCVEDWPYLYYVVLRILVCTSAIFYACGVYVHAEEIKNKLISYIMWGFTGIFGIIAILFNPLWPIHLSRDIWVPIDLVTAGIFFIGMFVIKLGYYMRNENVSRPD